MAEASNLVTAVIMPNLSSASKTPISSSNYNKSVLLHKWWLIKVESESKLGVGGYVNRETLGSRGMRLLGSASGGKRCNNSNNNLNTESKVFYSAAISKRLDNNTLETVDGFTITIIGSIHSSRTLSYGFSPQVCDHFLSGFPFNWEGYFGNFSHEKCERSLPLSFDDLPVTRARDILMSTARESEACAFTSMILKDILKQTELDHKQDCSSLKIMEEDCGNSRETEAARVSSRAETLPGSSCDTFCSLSDIKGEKCNKTRVMGSKWMPLRTHDGYPLRSKRLKKSNETD
ncbi:unnamed protein product [Lactuca saligna]|uniref:SANTA domain-containing protein n=1 Tax=Lactuca saligna TaxID=75948 RepID=A0AA35Y267_LACSI|nr:unnamed protein product [Lactuca saligna]